MMTTQGQLILLVFGGIALSHLIAGFGETLVRKGSAQLDGEVLKRINEHELRGSVFWRLTEKAAFILMIVGFFKKYFIAVKYGTWGIPAMAAGFALFCLANVARAWICRNSFAREAPGSQASRGALVAGIMTTLAELLVAGAVCSFIIARLPKHSSTVATAPDSSDGTGADQDNTTTEKTEPTQRPKPEPKWVDADEALKILKDRNREYLNKIAERQDVRAQKGADGKLEYHRDDLVKLKRDGMPTWDELGLKNPNPAPKPDDGE